MIGPDPDATVIDYLAAMLAAMPQEDVYGIAHPDTRRMLRKAYDGEALKNLAGGAEVAAHASGTAHVSVGASRRLVWATAPLTGWKVVLSIP